MLWDVIGVVQGGMGWYGILRDGFGLKGLDLKCRGCKMPTQG